MSSDDPLNTRRPARTFGRPPPQPVRPAHDQQPADHGRHTIHEGWSWTSGIMIISLVVIMIVALAVIPFVSRTLDRNAHSYGPVEPVDPGSRNDGSSGAGDPYYPYYGNGGYDVQKYAIDVSWRPQSQALVGRTTITARAEHRLDSFYLDLVLPVSAVIVGDAAAEFARESPYDVKITPKRSLRAGKPFTVIVSYAGNPADYKINNSTPWYVTGDEVTAAGEPEGAAWWYPSNDYPDDPATYQVTITVPAGMEAISNGRLASFTHVDGNRGGAYDRWRWVTDQTMDTYQSFISIGQYEIKKGTADGMPYLYAVSDQLPKETRQKAFANLARTPEIVAQLASYWGTYPYHQLGGIVPAHRLWYDGLEAATRPVYAARAIASDDATDLITHEQAHMWFGDTVTMEQWNDIFDNEAYASFSVWLRAERTGGRSADDQLNADYDRLKDNQAFWRIPMNDPGKDHLFDAVYYRGPMTLQALRNVIGDDAFFRLSRQWVQRREPSSLEDWMAAAQQQTTIDLTPFFTAWIYAETVPARTAANGFR
ncbi:M1 family metallopeptidase [Microlunatus elymi]|uniref:M1 family metallopeptidase n=1 Tax=Microlunatus elymi TaxID=2596828 RepID=A0A516PYE2_9ACTN|nr:M1 family metallopeptidase [Microlunatus elymi]QDP96183.1 M1 family metallopeptidase [Microlunatus elymi]